MRGSVLAGYKYIANFFVDGSYFNLVVAADWTYWLYSHFGLTTAPPQLRLDFD